MLSSFCSSVHFEVPVLSVGLSWMALQPPADQGQSVLLLTGLLEASLLEAMLQKDSGLCLSELVLKQREWPDRFYHRLYPDSTAVHCFPWRKGCCSSLSSVVIVVNPMDLVVFLGRCCGVCLVLGRSAHLHWAQRLLGEL